MPQAHSSRPTRSARRTSGRPSNPRSPSTRRHALALAAAAAAGGLLAATPAQALDHVWNGGDFSPGVTAPEPMPAADTLFIGTGTAKRFVGTHFTNQGLVRWQADALQGGNGASVTNEGTWQTESDANTLAWTFGGQATFTNRGTFSKTAGVQTLVGNWAFVNDGGLVDAQVGEIRFNGAAQSFLDGSRFTGAGTITVAGNSGFSGAFRADNLTLAAGSFAGTAARLDGGVAGAGAMGWTGGDLTGDWTFAAGTTVGGGTGASKRLVGAQVVVDGTLRWDTGDTLQGGNSSKLTNNGRIEVSQSASFDWNFGGRAQHLHNAGAVVQVGNGATLTYTDVALTSHGAQFIADAGAAVQYVGANNLFDGGTQFSGEHRFNGTSTFVDTITADDLRLIGGSQYGGTGAPGSMATLDGAATWQGSDLYWAWTIGAGSTVTAVDGGSKRQLGSTIVNLGTLRWDSTETLQSGNGSVLTNHGLVEVTKSATFDWGYGGRGAQVHEADGVLHVGGGATLTVGDIALTSHGALFSADAGSAVQYLGANNLFEDGTRFMGEHRFNGTSTFVGTITGDDMRLLGGSQFGGNGAADSRATLDGALTWQGSDLNRRWTIAAGSTVTAVDGGSKRQIGSDIVNLGTLRWDSANALQFGNGSALTNHGLIEVVQDAAFTWNYGGRGALVVESTGTVRAAAGATLTIGDVALTSLGGRFAADTGAAIVHAGSTSVFRDGTRFAGTNRVTGTARWIDAIDADDLHWAGGTQTGGDGSAASTGRLSGALAWEAGDVGGRFAFADGMLVTATGAGTKRQLGGEIVNGGLIRWDTTAALQVANGSVLRNDGRFELSDDASIVWSGGGQGRVENAGWLAKTGGAGTSSLASIALVNTGTLAALSGTVALPTGWHNGGTLAGTTGFSFGGTLVNEGHVAPGLSTGTLTLAGHVAFDTASFLDVELTGLLDHDLLLVGGDASLGGTLALSCLGACALDIGDELVILDAAGQLSGSFADVTLAGFASGAFDVVYDTVDDRVLLRVTEAVTPAVPEPGTTALMLAGLGVFGALARRRRVRG